MVVDFLAESAWLIAVLHPAKMSQFSVVRRTLHIDSQQFLHTIWSRKQRLHQQKTHSGIVVLCFMLQCYSYLIRPQSYKEYLDCANKIAKK